MSVDLSTYAAVDSELAETADYDVTESLSKAQRRAAALRRKLDFAQTSTQDSGKSLSFDTVAIRQQLAEVLSWITSYSQSGSVVHADFSAFGQYGGGS